jgi:hypothetical protein
MNVWGSTDEEMYREATETFERTVVPPGKEPWELVAFNAAPDVVAAFNAPQTPAGEA